MSRRPRQFAITGGRARDESDLPLELPITATGRTGTTPLSPDHQRIISLCADRQTLVDLSAQTDLPVGVLRVLILDLVEAGLLDTGNKTMAAEVTVPPHRDISLLEEVLDGIGNL